MSFFGSKPLPQKMPPPPAAPPPPPAPGKVVTSARAEIANRRPKFGRRQTILSQQQQPTGGLSTILGTPRI